MRAGLRTPLASGDSQMPSAPHDHYAKVAYFGMAYSDFFHNLGQVT